MVAVTADHGEEFGDHGGAYHGTSLFDEQSRVPLLLAVPGLAPGRVPTAVSTIDLLPTFVGLTDLPWAAPMDGATLAGLTSAATAPPRTAFAELEGLKMAVAGRYKLLCDMSRDFCQLFNLVADPAERRDLSLRLPGIKAPMLATLRRWVGRPIPEIGDGTAPPSAQARLLERASRGETAALTAVAESLRTQADRQHTPVVDRRLAIQLLATQQPPSNLDLLELVAGDDPDWLVRAWAMVGTAVGGRSRRAAQVADLVVPDEQRHLLAFRALALTAIASPLGPPQTVEALGLIEDSHLRCRLLKTLAASRHALALPQLRQTYPDVRTRLCVAQALSEIRSAEATAFVRERLKDEPYTTVRAALARALGRSGSRSTCSLRLPAPHLRRTRCRLRPGYSGPDGGRDTPRPPKPPTTSTPGRPLAEIRRHRGFDPSHIANSRPCFRSGIALPGGREPDRESSHFCNTRRPRCFGAPAAQAYEGVALGAQVSEAGVPGAAVGRGGSTSSPVRRPLVDPVRD